MKKPGEFHATCLRPRWVTLEQLLDVDPDTTTSRWDSKLNCNVFQIRCAFVTDDRAAYVRHTKVHSGWRITTQETQTKAIRRMWRPARLTEEGTAFEPADLEPGAAVTWTESVPTGGVYYDEELGRRVDQLETIDRTGGVWCAGPYPMSVWVIPDDRLAGEGAVCLRRYRRGGVLEHCGVSKTRVKVAS